MTPLSLMRHTSITVLDRRMVLSIETMRLSSTVMEIWPFEVLPGRLFQEQRSVVCRSVLNITLISYTLFATLEKYRAKSKNMARDLKIVTQ